MLPPSWVMSSYGSPTSGLRAPDHLRAGRTSMKWLTPLDLSLNGHAKERRRDRRAGVARVLLVEQGLELGLQIRLAAVRGSCRERVHGRSVVIAELADHLRRRAVGVERIRVPLEGDLLLRDARRGEALDHVVLDTPRHRADEPLGGWR